MNTKNLGLFAVVGLVVSALAGCGMTEEKFQDKAIDKSCDAYMDCDFGDTKAAQMFSFDDKGECVAFMQAFLPLMESDTCEFDPDAAQECLAAYDDLTCDDLMSENGSSPEVCADVYSGDCGGDNTEVQ